MNDTAKKQLEALNLRFPDKNYSEGNSPESISLDYRKLIVCPQLRQLIDMKLCKTGDGNTYQDNCLEIVKETLSIDFSSSIPVKGSRTLKSGNSETRIRDITIQVPHQNLGNHWQTIIHENCNEHEYCIRSIVFECKNYSRNTHIKRKEIYQLYEYLTPQQYGKFGVILSRFGKDQLSDDAKIAIRRLMLDNYRILVLGNNEILDWINIYENTGSSETFFAKCTDSTRSYLL